MGWRREKSIEINLQARLIYTACILQSEFVEKDCPQRQVFIETKERYV
jgi:hypothetical protein